MADRDIPNVVTHPAKTEWDAEQAECAHMFLDDRGVPRLQNGQQLSLVGRIRIYGERYANRL